MCKFGSFKNPFATIISLPELYFRLKRFILLLQMKKLISMNYGSSTSSWKPWRWVRLDMILMMRDIYINSNLNPFTKFNSSSRNTEFKDILPWHSSQMITKTVPSSTRIVTRYVWKGVSGCEFDGKSMEIETTTWSEFPNRWKAIVEQILVTEERKKSKREGLRITVCDWSRKVNHMCRVVWNRKNYNRVHQIYLSHQNRLASPYGGH